MFVILAHSLLLISAGFISDPHTLEKVSAFISTERVGIILVLIIKVIIMIYNNLLTVITDVCNMYLIM